MIQIYNKNFISFLKNIFYIYFITFFFFIVLQFLQKCNDVLTKIITHFVKPFFYIYLSILKDQHKYSYKYNYTSMIYIPINSKNVKVLTVFPANSGKYSLYYIFIIANQANINDYIHYYKYRWFHIFMLNITVKFVVNIVSFRKNSSCISSKHLSIL